MLLEASDVIGEVQRYWEALYSKRPVNLPAFERLVRAHIPKGVPEECRSVQDYTMQDLKDAVRQAVASCRPPKYLTDGVPSNIWGVYSPQIFHGRGSVKYLGGLQPPNISRKGFRQIFWGCTPRKYLTDGVPSNIWGLYTPKIFDGWGSVKYLGGLQPPNI